MTRDDTTDPGEATVDAAAETADIVEQHRPAAPAEEAATPEPAAELTSSAEADPADVADQHQPVALNDELRAEPLTWSDYLARPEPPAE